MTPTGEWCHVAVAVIREAAATAGGTVRQGARVLITRRHAHVHQGGLWEFPGGKVEPGETPYQALQRELREELGLQVGRARPLIRVPHDYPDRRVLLEVWQVDEFQGAPQGCEGQALRWVRPEDLDRLEFPAANRPVVRAVQLPDRYLITPSCKDEAAFLQRLTVLSRVYPLLQLRVPGLDEAAYARLARRVLTLCAGKARVMLNCEPTLARSLGAAGVHLNSRRLMALRERPLPRGLLVAASCHDRIELAQAVRLGLDFAVLSPVKATASHPGGRPLGWERFRALVDEAALPVYALGGLGVGDLPRAWACGAQGVAAVRAFWKE